MLLGAHEGIAGGVSTAFARAEEDGAECLQIFTRNARGWAAKPLEADEVARFRAEARRTGLPAAAHSSYLINAAAADPEIRRKSWAGLADELQRCEQLGLFALIFHPGSNPDEAEGLRLAAEGMAQALEAAPGQGEAPHRDHRRPGRQPGPHLRAAGRHPRRHPGAAAPPHRGLRRHLPPLLRRLRPDQRRGLRRPPSPALDRTLGLGLVHAFHLNDSKKPLGSRVDRHEHIGEGTLGLSPFRRLVNDRRFARIPGFLETDLRYRENLSVLRSLIA